MVEACAASRIESIIRALKAELKRQGAHAG
jgi:hypothetical protein